MAYYPHLPLPAPLPPLGLQRKALFMRSAAVCTPHPSPHSQEGGTPCLNVMGKAPSNPPTPTHSSSGLLCEAGSEFEPYQEKAQGAYAS